MTKATVAVIAIILMIGSGLAAPVDWTVYLRRAGPLRIGMSVSEVRRLLNDPRAYLAYVDREPDDAECAYLQSPTVPKSLGFMFQNGRLVRIEVRQTGVRTASGAKVGDTEDRIKRLYPGRITVERHKYSDVGHYLNYVPAAAADNAYGMVFETDGAKVTSFRTGTRAAIALVEGCS